jgi:hypothetical protein
MNHLNEEQLVLYYYGEGAGVPEIEDHLGACEHCRESYHSLQRVLNSVDSLPVPDRGADYEGRVWRAIESRLPRKRSFWQRMGWRPLAVAVSMAGLLIAAFFAGRTSSHRATQSAADPQLRERILLVAVGDHLERSQTMLVELSNTSTPKQGHIDISYEQQAAEDLLEANRLYRQTAASTGDEGTATLLDDLERVLLEIAHSPAEVSAKQLDELRREIEDRGILFKVKVFGKQVEQRQAAPQNNSSL